ncbi:hypothetical protein H0I29_01060 [Polaribacter sp. R2A056_3_33]|uniref:hypothetical protein n=1 Tax=Polaribacter sp. R2A056_3_33 TaxID=2745563 RepID=UPI001C4F5F10|nr:hypothetical protein [Polaribacter sp. R2A056_3_33]QXP70720.1 hypothetical protein H0I29_01060 [Polaribacter sp. R2A056_3_33]
MKKSETKIFVGIGVLILLIDILLMKYWVSIIEPYSSMSVGIESYRPRIFIVNILIGMITFLIKKRFSILFFVNTIICYLIFSFFWNSWIENHPYSQTNYHFKIENRNLRLDISENPNTYGIYELNQNPNDSLKIIEMGMNEKKGDSIILKWWKQGENFEMYFYKNKLIGFPENPKGIEMKKQE